MKRLLLIIYLLFYLAGCTPHSVNGVYRPSAGTFRHTYIKEFPVNKATKQEVLDFVGTPDKTHIYDGIEYLTFITENDPTWHVEYSYLVKDGIVVDVKVISQTPIFGNEIYQHSRMNK